MNRQHGDRTLRSNMTLRFRSLSALAGALCCGCVIVPVQVDTFDYDCKVVTHRVELQAIQLRSFYGCEANNRHFGNVEVCEVAVIGALGLTAASAVVSGSVMVVGNAVFWAERQATCVAPQAPAPAPVASAVESA
jgi:hypothetical protein